MSMNTTTTASARKSPVYLDSAQKYAVYKYAVEHHSILQKGEEIVWRVNHVQLAKEINDVGVLENVKITNTHIPQCITTVLEWQKLLDRLPAIPKQTVEMDMMQAKVARLEHEIEAIKKERDQLKYADSAQTKTALDKLARIKAILGA